MENSVENLWKTPEKWGKFKKKRKKRNKRKKKRISPPQQSFLRNSGESFFKKTLAYLPPQKILKKFFEGVVNFLKFLLREKGG